MSGINGKVSGLNSQVFQALNKINTQDGINKTEAQTLAQAIDADGHVDAAEADLLENLFSSNSSISVSAENAEFSPIELNFGGAGEDHVEHLSQEAIQVLAASKMKALFSESEQIEEGHGNVEHAETHEGDPHVEGGPHVEGDPHAEGDHGNVEHAEGHEDGHHQLTDDKAINDVKHWQHTFHDLHLKTETAEKLAHFLSKSKGLAKVIEAIPRPANLKVIEMLAEVSGKYGPKALHSLGKALESKLMKGVMIGGDVIGAGYYGGIATGLNYPNHQVDGVEYEVRPSVRTKSLAGLTAAIYTTSAAATASGVGAVAAIGLSMASLVSGGIADWSLDRDKEMMEHVVKNVMGAKTGEELKHGIENLRAEYGSLSDVQEVLGEVGIHQDGGSVVTMTDNKDDSVDRQLAGAVANRILESAINGEIDETYAKDALGELLSGVGERWTSDDDVAQSFVNQVFLKFGKNEEDFSKALSLLGSETRLALFNMLDGGITWGDTGSENLNWLLNESSSDISEAKVMEFLADIEPDISTRGKMIGSLIDGTTRERFEDLAFKLIDKTYSEAKQSGNMGDFHKLLDEIKIDGDAASRMTQLADELDADRAGKILGWMVQSGAPSQHIENYIQEMSSQWTNDDDITTSFLAELSKQKIATSTLKDSLSQDAVKLLFDNLEAGWTSNSEYGNIEKLASAANGEAKAYMLERLMKGSTFTRAEEAMSSIINGASPGQMKTIVNHVNTRDLGSEIEGQSAYSQAMKQVLGTGSDGKSAAFISGGSQSSVIAAYSDLSSAEKSKLGDQSKKALFKHFVNAGRYTESKAMMDSIKGDLNKKDMSTYLADNITRFSNATEAGKAAAWVMANGSQNSIDTAFSNISGKWYGKGGEIVKAAIDQAKADHLDIKGKLSMSSLKSMTGSLNTAWTKMFGDYGQNLKYVEDLANLTNSEGKTAIIQDLMVGWTPGEAETLIKDIFENTTDWKEFTQLVDGVGPQKLASELEDRKELGQVMAFIVERYESKSSTGGRDQDVVLNQIMNTWSSSSIKSDDVIHHMLKQLEGDGKLGNLKSWVNDSTLDTMIDWTDDAFRDGNFIDLDPESAWSVRTLKAAK